jgi:CheY-like chemotaxis protein
LRVLLVEDEPHKSEELSQFLSNFYANDLTLVQVDSVRAAYWAVTDSVFDLIVLDMALPTFSSEESATQRGLDQALGGLEVLRALQKCNKTGNIVIITQYPDITIAGKRVKIVSAVDTLSQRYNQNILGGIVYKYKSPSNMTKIKNILKKIP